MLLKKSALIGTALGILSLPIIASANTLETYNYTQEPSTVKVTNSAHLYCSGSFGGITPKMTGTVPGHLSTSVAGVRTICEQIATPTFTCIADMYPANNCTGARIARLSLTVSQQTITNVKLVNMWDTRYSINIAGTRVELHGP